jgi:pimeloyl-ACP methyl ester carboxylesterase
MAAAVALAVNEARRMAGTSAPVYLIGYSIGGALSVHHALEALHGMAEPIDGLVLISPAIGLTPLAGLASVQAGMGHLLGLRALAWNSVALEYDPFKYGSFAINAARQSYLLTEAIKGDIDRAGAKGLLAGMPPILAFQSILDATVSVRAVIDSLFRKLPAGPYELVLFDVNHRSAAVKLLSSDPGGEIEALLEDGGLAFTLSLVTNIEPSEQKVAVGRRAPSDAAPREIPIGLSWPDGVYSLSHVALPFPASDPLYGDGSASDSPGIRLGNLALRGERGGIVVSPGEMLRLRWNPFYPYLEQHILEFSGLAKPAPR